MVPDLLFALIYISNPQLMLGSSEVMKRSDSDISKRKQ
ncbi:hypothetical protein EMIT043CA1_160084 [Pseudomonas brassicacearum]